MHPRTIAFASLIMAAAALPAWSRAGATGSTVPAPASSTQRARRVEALYAEGVALFRAGAYREALARFQKAYGVFPAANLLYNIGRCQEALGEIDEALASYRQCMDRSDASAEAKLRAAQHYQSLVQARVTGAKAAKAKPQARAASTSSTRTSPAGLPWYRTTAWIVLPLGVALAVAGGVSYGLGVHDHHEIENQPGFGDATRILDMTRAKALDLEDRGKLKKQLGIALLATGGALAVGSTVLLLWPRREHARRRDDGARSLSMTVAPLATTGRAAVEGATLLVHGAF